MKTALSAFMRQGFVRRALLVPAVLALTGAGLLAQIAIPATPKKFTKRVEGSGGASIGPGLAPSTPKPPPVVRTTMYYTLSDSRQWTSADGKPLLAKLIAFEEHVIETQGNQPPPVTAPPMPTNPTLVRDGKARLLSGNTPYEVPLERLSQPDRDFIEGIRAAVAAKNAQANTAPAEKK
ncbi:hypothetical protein DES53_102739 [Roseimicrobium gellanilyticum]|uniref:Uncharacterized protein n=1 Tax=Roseimicrobium gellanilyticum TaxID=748857 RepID=A0A366HTC5_9BACT|nr:hypothetical protein [Roseimicrobium gellanilyticum]RBP46348.1 hypothetical protein DES53_102739 [Roseimicrobium gellanilyticum]